MKKMRKSLSVIALTSISLLAGCAQQKPHYTYGTQFTQTAKNHFQPTNPVCIKMLDKSNLHKDYTVIGTVSASLLNFYGIKRQRATLNWLLDKQAAKMGGDALINQHTENGHMVATVIRFDHPAVGTESKA